MTFQIYRGDVHGIAVAVTMEDEQHLDSVMPISSLSNEERASANIMNNCFITVF